MILLFDRTVRVGDFVVLPDGQEGHVEAINMRSTIVSKTLFKVSLKAIIFSSSEQVSQPASKTFSL